jgi:hypothetical protein
MVDQLLLSIFHQSRRVGTGKFLYHSKLLTIVDTLYPGRSLRIHLGSEQFCLRDLVLRFHAGDVEPYARGAGRNVLEQGISPQLPQI